jgi:hypothetical protein
MYAKNGRISKAEHSTQRRLAAHRGGTFRNPRISRKKCSFP